MPAQETATTRHPDLSEQEIKGLSRIVLAIHSREPLEKPKDYDDKLVRVGRLIPFVAGVQIGYDSSDSRADTSPLTTFAKVMSFNPKVTILDTRFARDSWEGMRKDLVDFEKEHHKKERQIRSGDVQERKVARGDPVFVLPTPDEMTMDVDMKTSHELAHKTAVVARRHHIRIAAVVGTSRKPLDEYIIDPAEYTCGLIDMLRNARLEKFRAIVGVTSVEKTVDHCFGMDIPVSATGAYLPDYDPNLEFIHPAPMDLRDVSHVDASFILGTPLMAATDPYEATLAHAFVLGE